MRGAVIGEVDLNESLEISPGVFKRLGDCTGSEIESAIRLIARARIDRAWIDEQAAGPDQGGLTIGRRFFANVSEAERDLIAYWQMVKLAEEERLRHARAREAQGQDEAAGERLIDQALATVIAADSLGPDDQISFTNEQALVWAVYLRVIARHRNLASDEEVKHSVEVAANAGVSPEEIEAAIAAADRPEARDER
jgi:Arc/MetJ-type ribon-helix-helix transcriptional regulator